MTRKEKHLFWRGLVLDLSQRTCFLEGQSIALTSREFDLLSVLMKNRRRIVSLKKLVRDFWGPGASAEGLHTYIARLRSKIETSRDCRVILNIHGRGYRLI
jgi:DNA-binding response OmpR family regulator